MTQAFWHTHSTATGSLLAAAGAHAAGGGGASTGAIIIAVLAAALLLGCAVWALARFQAWEPHWALSLRHALEEARFRTQATWSELAEWLKLGR